MAQGESTGPYLPGNCLRNRTQKQQVQYCWYCWTLVKAPRNSFWGKAFHRTKKVQQGEAQTRALDREGIFSNPKPLSVVCIEHTKSGSMQ